MSRSQRHRIQVYGTAARDAKGTIPNQGAYMGSHLRPGATAGATTRGRAGGAQSAEGVGGVGTEVGGYAGTAGGGVASAGHVDGSIAPSRPLPGA